ncbi:MAG: hypothetical protein AABY06_00020 [Nanoarchaeota archaeon]
MTNENQEKNQEKSAENSYTKKESSLEMFRQLVYEIQPKNYNLDFQKNLQMHYSKDNSFNVCNTFSRILV